LSMTFARTFFSWNSMVERTLTSLFARSSAWDIGVGNLPAGCVSGSCYKEELMQDAPLERPGPRRRGICLMSVFNARNASYFFASFLTSFLFLLRHERLFDLRLQR
jgi:hypothetical protein